MWRWLKGLTNRMRLLRSGHYWNDGPSPSPLDPESLVRSPRPVGPPGRIASAAVDEPQDDDDVAAVGGLARAESIRSGCARRTGSASRVH